MRNSIVCWSAACLIVCANIAVTATATEETNNPVEPPPRPDYWPWTIGIEGGTEAIGGMFGIWRFEDHLGVRAGADYTTWSVSDYGIRGIHYDATARLLSEPFTLNIYPWKRYGWYVSAGWMFNQNQLTGSASDQGTIVIDGQPFPTDQVGALNLKVRQQWVSPYVSIGGNFLYFDHAHHWALGGEIGVAYTGDPQVSLTRTGPPSDVIDSAVRAAQSQTQNWANQFRWYPIAKIQLSFSFK